MLGAQRAIGLADTDMQVSEQAALGPAGFDVSSRCDEKWK